MNNERNVYKIILTSHIIIIHYKMLACGAKRNEKSNLKIKCNPSVWTTRDDASILLSIVGQTNTMKLLIILLHFYLFFFFLTVWIAYIYTRCGLHNKS